ncbi:hypothetical protein [Paenibacillus montanisoli]|uniref:Uncharacterized protein n=1 Tax=Paenibacillus montanisoli TaxID=2081970 RepID=A0A328TX09_9BACL|nr:hypothetical protein [Paenibacillus montanisoli]RAP73621.1 hypothetical protein DL346_25455 [Paenibacillus montanisoli]
MKRIIILLFVLLLSACGSSGRKEKEEAAADPAVLAKMSAPKLVHKDDLFEMKLNIAKTTFAQDEPIVYSTSLTYIGEQDSITIWGGRTYIGFNISDGKTFRMEGANTSELASTKLAKGVTTEYPFFKSGGFGADDPDAEFWREFYAEKELRLPPGNYLISAFCDFSLDESVVDSRYNGEVYTMITVE